MKNKRAGKFLGTSFQKKIFFLVFLASVVPATVMVICIDYLILNLVSAQAALPEVITAKLMPILGTVNLIMIIALPITLLLIGWLTWVLSHRIAGPVYRIERELEERIAGTKHGPITLRRKDELQSLVGKLNKLLNK